MGLDSVEILIAVEEEFGIQIPNEDAPTLALLGDFCDYVIRALQAKGESPDPDKIWERFQKLIIFELDVKPHQVTRSTHLIKDLRLD